MSLFLLDTSIASAAIRGERSLDARLTSLPNADLCISAITRAELRYGIARRTEATRLTDLVEGFLAIARCEAWDTRAADARGSLRARLADRGTRIGDFDEMIAAHALALDAILVTDNTRHFAHVEGLTVENWRRAC